MTLKVVSAVSLLMALGAHLPAAYGVCLDPETGKSGYKIPLNREVRTAEAIVIGRVLSEHPLREEADDPDGITASSVTVKVLKKLKGTLSGLIVLRNENTSSRYPMSVGEEHVLFVSRANHDMWINSCGNSSVMPDGEQVARKVSAHLRAMK
jgi:hypothetical protein